MPPIAQSTDSAAAPAPESLVSVINRGNNTYTHGDIVLKPGNVLAVPPAVFEVMKGCTEGGVQVISEVAAEATAAAKAAAADANEALAAEQAKSATLEARLAAAEKALAEQAKLLETATAPAPAPEPAVPAGP
jgi:hypothetical protein